MRFFVDLFRDGGPFMFVLLASLLLLSPVALLRLVLAPQRRWPALGLVTTGAFLGLGLAGTFQGLGLALDAVAHASPEHQGQLLEAGQRVALVTTWTGLCLSALFVPVHAGAIFLARRNTPSRLQLPALLGGALVALLTLTACFILVITVLQLDVLVDSYQGGLDTSAEWSRASKLALAGLLCASLAALTAVPAGLLSGMAALLGPPREA